jgi:membrane protease subunit HflK
LLAAAAVLFLLAALPQCFLVVEPGHQGIVQHWGRVVAEELPPGLHLHPPPPIGRGVSVPVGLVRQVEIGFRSVPGGRHELIPEQAVYLTMDENIVDIRAVVHYRVSDASRFRLGVEAVPTLINSMARRDLVEITSRTPIDQLYSTRRRQTERGFRDSLRRRVAELDIGCEIVDARLLAVHSPAMVHDAFRDVASALEDRERLIHEASGYAAARQAAARGEAALITETARADSAYAINRALGQTAEFLGLAGAYVLEPRLTRTRLYLETLERVLARTRTYIHAASGSRGEVDLWIGAKQARPVELPKSD